MIFDRITYWKPLSNKLATLDPESLDKREFRRQIGSWKMYLRSFKWAAKVIAPRAYVRKLVAIWFIYFLGEASFRVTTTLVTSILEPLRLLNDYLIDFCPYREREWV